MKNQNFPYHVPVTNSRSIFSNEVVLIVDCYLRRQDVHSRGQANDPGKDAQSLSQLMKPFGRNIHRIAIVARNDAESIAAYQNAGFDVRAMSLNRTDELRDFITQMQVRMEAAPPSYLFLVTIEPTFTFLARTAYIRQVEVTFWSPRASTPSDFLEYNFMPLEDLLSGFSPPRVGMWLDYENLHVGLVNRGWKPNPSELIKAAKAEIADLGEVVNVTAYGDWGLLSRGSGADIQRQLTEQGVETRYLVNMNGKNSADMKIADDIRNLVEMGGDSPNAVDVIALGSGDRDFRPTIERARASGQKIVVVSLKDSMSATLRQAVGESNVRYLDSRLKLESRVSVSYKDEHAKLILEISAWLNRHRWRWAFADKLKEAFATTPNGAERLHRAIADGILKPLVRGGGQAFALDLNHPLVVTSQRMVHLIPEKIHFCLGKRDMPYIDSNFLAISMARDGVLQSVGAGQSRPEAEGWLGLLHEIGMLEREERENPKAEGRMINIWNLREAVADQKQDPDAGPEAETTKHPVEENWPTKAPRPGESRLNLKMLGRLDAPQQPQSTAI